MTYSLPPRLPRQVLWLLQVLSPLRALPPLL